MDSVRATASSGYDSSFLSFALSNPTWEPVARNHPTRPHSRKTGTTSVPNATNPIDRRTGDTSYAFHSVGSKRRLPGISETYSSRPKYYNTSHEIALENSWKRRQKMQRSREKMITAIVNNAEHISRNLTLAASGVGVDQIFESPPLSAHRLTAEKGRSELHPTASSTLERNGNYRPLSTSQPPSITVSRKNKSPVKDQVFIVDVSPLDGLVNTGQYSKSWSGTTLTPQGILSQGGDQRYPDNTSCMDSGRLNEASLSPNVSPFPPRQPSKNAEIHRNFRSDDIEFLGPLESPFSHYLSPMPSWYERR
ncbi:hypothetical protein PM082_006756 [Marasmius tenuissimus]|nr:hypothetical protein PM082_001912 [Marasmius tenuissimus]KAJ8094219.1 hypothetical protein PM082_006756 [Marasmius tenuissimus]